MKRLSFLVLVAVLMFGQELSKADTIQGISIDFVNIGNAGNAADTTGYGAVGYDYRIGKYEVTNAQWNAFTSVAGVPTGNPSDAYVEVALFTGAQQPTNNVSWYEAAQFCNYLTSGNKSLGAYQLGTDGSITVDRAAAILKYGTAYVIPTENEWYKAAYHKNDGATGNYWLYPTKSNNVPSNDLNNSDPGNNANFYQNGFTIGSPNFLTAVGEFENSDSAYGTFDQGGNVWEWNETLIGSYRGLRSGACYYGESSLASSYRLVSDPSNEGDDIGFRVASIPEPATLLLLGVGAMMLRKRKS